MLDGSLPGHRAPDVLGDHLVRTRLRYLNVLLFDAGIVSGFLTVWGTIFLALAARRRVDCRVLVGMLVTFFVFLAAAPVSFHPFRLVEMQGYYLTVLFPMLAIGCGGALAGTLALIKERPFRWSLIAALVVGFGTNVFIPDTTTSATFEFYWNHEFDGIRQILRDGPSQGIAELWLPKNYDELIPDSYYALGTKIHLYGANDVDSAESVAAALQADPARAVFIRRKMIKYPLILLIKSGEYKPGCEIVDEDKPLADLLVAKGCTVEKVPVPADVWSGWLAHFGIKKGERYLGGWVYRFKNAI